MSVSRIHKFLSISLLGAGVLVVPAASQAITIVPTDAAAVISAALTAGNVGLIVDSITINKNGSAAGGDLSIGTYTNPSGTYGIGDGIVISSGKVSDYNDGANTTGGKTTAYGTSATAAQDAVLDAIGGAGNYFDVTEILVNFHLAPTFDTVFFNVVFGSDEFPEFVGSQFIDGFGLLVNGTNIAFAGGNPININHPAFTAMAGTELDGIIAPGGKAVMTFGQLLANPQGANTLQFIIADKSDFALDSTAYIGALGAQNPAPPAAVPEPGTLALLGSGLALAVRRARARRKTA